MSWKKHFKIVAPVTNPPPAHLNDVRSGGSSSKYSSYLPEIYAGHPNRIQRYYQYEDMNRDSDINAALDTIADFCTQSEEQNDSPFETFFHEEANETEIKLLKTYMSKWLKLNNFRSSLWFIFRHCVMNGDQFFLRDPETNEWLWIDHFNVELVKVDETQGKKPDEYIIRNLDYNKQMKFATTKADPSQYRTPLGTNSATGGARPAVNAAAQASTFSMAGSARDPRAQSQITESMVIDAEHVIHLSLSVGMDINWPFGQSILEPVFKVFKQKELLEDAIIIYRVQRAPERRVFYIDVGNMPAPRANAYIERIKNEIHQRRIPNRTGGGASIMDAAYNPLCIALDTVIPLLDGRKLSLSALIAEHEAGKENWVYSADPVTGRIVPGNITWAGVTRRDASVIKLHLDNGETVTCTPDHKIPLLGRGFVEAKDIKPEDSLISFNTRLEPLTSSTKDRTYQQVYDHEKNDWVFTHRMVGEFFRTKRKHKEFTYLHENVGKVKNVIHHEDYDRYNNDPRNLAYMNKDDHVLYHVHQKKEYWRTMPADEAQRIRTKIGDSLRVHFAKRTTEERQEASRSATVRLRGVRARMRVQEPERYERLNRELAERGREFRELHPDHLVKLAASDHGTYAENFPNQEYVYTQRMLSMFVDVVKAGYANQKEALAHLNESAAFLAEIAEANPAQAGKNNKINYSSMPLKRLQHMLTHFGYTNWKDFVRKIPEYNHKVVSIEIVEEPINVGTLTIDGPERWHAYHTFALESGVFVKNSIMEDYFFAQSSEGRGSKVETLPGGDNLGEIGDLSFFNNKLMRGLRIPPSYLPSGSEDSQVAYNDGKLGAAMIQEFRFSKYCVRLQALLAPVFDKEFKRYLSENGIQIESTLFELRFNQPQNFTKYRQIELDSAQMNVFSSISEYKKMSERFKLKRFLNLSEEELIENETLWAEENADKLKKVSGATPAETEFEDDLGSVGVRGGDMGGMPTDLGGEDELGAEDAENGEEGGGEEGDDGDEEEGAGGPL